MLVQTRVARVVVYRNGALVVRAGRAPAGESEVGGLPLLFNSDSLRLRPTEGRVLGVRESCTLERAEAAPPQERKAAAEAARAEVARCERRLQEVVARVEALEAAEVPPNEKRGLPPTERIVELHDFVGVRLEQLAGERDAAEGALSAARRQRDRLRDEQADPRPPRYTRGLRFSLEAEADFELEYFVEGARWVPTYTLALDDGQASLRLDALIAQASGEDWSGAEVQVSTADLARETRLPELASWRIGTSQPARRKAWRAPPEGLEVLFAGYHSAAPPPPPEAMLAPVTTPMEAEEAEVDVFAEDDAEFLRTQDSFGGTPPPAQAPPSPMVTGADFAALAPASLSAKRRGGGGGPPMEAPVAGNVRPPDDGLSPRLRYPWLRLAGPDERRPGTLQPMDPITQLHTLVEDAPPEAPEQLRRAIAALRSEARRLDTPPAGTTALGSRGDHHLLASEGACDLPADGHWHRVAVFQTEAPARTEYRCVPRHSKEVFRYCFVKPRAAVALPSGPIQVYIDGTFKVSARLQGGGGAEALELNLGLEPALRVLERKVHTKQTDKGLMSQTTRVDHSVLVRVRSALGTPVQLRVHDRLPLAPEDQKDLSVTLLESTPTAEPTDRDARGRPLEGGLRFSVEVPPGEVSAVTWQYRLELPSRMEIQGGNRRE